MIAARHTSHVIVAAGLAAFAAAPANASLIEGFTGPYDVSNWTAVIEGDGRILTEAPFNITLIGADNSEEIDGPLAQNVDFTIAAVASGTVSFDWFYSTRDSGSFWDPFGYLLNGVFFTLTSDWIDTIDREIDTETGSASFEVLAGDIFGFRQASLDSCCGAGSAQIFLSSAPGAGTVPVSEPASLVLLGLGLAGLGVMRRRRASPG